VEIVVAGRVELLVDDVEVEMATVVPAPFDIRTALVYPAVAPEATQVPATVPAEL
jgi:hypothetical protein